jgi:hypothetical protein
VTGTPEADAPLARLSIEYTRPIISLKGFVAVAYDRRATVDKNFEGQGAKIKKL